MHYIFIFNGREDKLAAAESVKAQIEALAEKPSFEYYYTTAPKDATVFVKNYCAEHKDEEVCFVACGGDGTINEVACGIVGEQNKCFAIIAMGTGNDFVKYWPGKNFKSVEGLLKGEVSKIDAIKVNDTYCVNITDIGFDAVVGDTGAILSARGWKGAYRWGIVVAILTGRFNNIHITADGELLNKKKMLLCSLANNHYVGGEFFCAPRAVNNDGLIDVCLVKTISLFKFLALLPVYTAGKHLDDPRFEKIIVYRQAKKVKVDTPKTINICIDGEMISGTHFTAEIIPASVRLVIPE